MGGHGRWLISTRFQISMDAPFDLQPEDDDFGAYVEVDDEVPDDIAAEWNDNARGAAQPAKEREACEERGPCKQSAQPGEKRHTEPRSHEAANDEWVRARLKEWFESQPKEIWSPVETKEESKGWRGESSDDEEKVDVQKAKLVALVRGAAATKRSVAEREADELQRNLLEFPPVSGDSVAMTFFDGERYFVAVQPPTRRVRQLPREEGSLLTVSVEAMRAELRAADVEKIRRLESEGDEVPCRTDTTLWVDKYAPQRYHELLSDDWTNRNTLRALKNWDPFVFGRPAPKPESHGAPPPWQKKKRSPNAPFKKPADEEKVLGEDGRPIKRVLMLAGDPGTGKTTLARVLARVAGYRVVEIIASEERSQGAIERAIVNAQTNRSISKGHVSSEPTCVVLDELDGLDAKRSIAAIVDMATAPLTRTATKNASDDADNEQEAEDFQRKRVAKRKKGRQALTRPLICVCNDPYAQHLRPLREVATFFHLRQSVSSQRLVMRLRAVILAEGLGSISTAALEAVVKASRGDIRACLHTLQFVTSSRRHKGHGLDAALVTAADSGAIKDGVSDDMEIWTAVFTRPRDSAYRRPLAIAPDSDRNVVEAQSNTKSTETESQTQLSCLLNAVGSLETDRFCAAVHENYASVCAYGRDHSLDKLTNTAMDLSDADLFLGVAYRTGTYDFAKYAAATSCASAFARCRLDRPPRIRPPKYRAKDAGDAYVSVFKIIDDARASWCRPSSSIEGLPSTLQRLGITTLALDVAPLLRRVVLNLNIRPVGLELMRQQERILVDATARTMASNGLSFERAHAANDPRGPTWQLRPDLHAATHFAEHVETKSYGGDKTTKRQLLALPLAHITCQLLAREVALTVVRDREAAAKARQHDEVPIIEEGETRIQPLERPPCTAAPAPTSPAEERSNKKRVNMFLLLQQTDHQRKRVKKSPSRIAATHQKNDALPQNHFSFKSWIKPRALPKHQIDNCHHAVHVSAEISEKLVS